MSQEGQLSVTAENMWLTIQRTKSHQESVNGLTGRQESVNGLTDQLDMTLTKMTGPKNSNSTRLQIFR